MAPYRHLTYNDEWLKAQLVPSDSYQCGYCGMSVASDRGWATEDFRAVLRICPDCWGPTFFAYDGSQYPGPLLGTPVQSLPSDLEALYVEARASAAARSYTASIMVCRKIVMHVAVEKGAKENQSFQAYVDWLIAERYVPRGAETWLDYIRKRGNEANHEIVLMNLEDATGVVLFTQALLHAVYELPNAVPPIPKPKAGTP